MNKGNQDILIIEAGLGSKELTAGQDGLCFRPYKDKTIIGRVLREIWFRLGLKEAIWYNKIITQYSPNLILVKDCLITRDYLSWLVEEFPKSRITYQYCNLVGKAKHLLPVDVPKGIELVTFDPGDSKKYQMILAQGHEFPKCNLRQRLPIEYDVFYVGTDKGRAESLLELKEQMEAQGLNVKMLIMRDSKLSRWKPFYSKRIPYEKVLEYDCKSKAILNIVHDGQSGATMRDYESIFLKSKLITNNTHIKEYDFYKRENVFILGEDDFSKIKEFVDLPFEEIDSSILERHER